jgi:16S rRNA (cytosine967-C5)-methyltransferase
LAQSHAHVATTNGIQGLDARRLAWAVVSDVLRRRAALDEVLEGSAAQAQLPARDAALARAIATVTFRHLGSIRRALTARLSKGLPPDERLFTLLATGAAQILFLDVADHAAVDLSVRLARGERLQHAAGMVNAVLRRIARERAIILAEADPLDADTPDWLAARWRQTYGLEQARAIAEAQSTAASVDLTVKADPETWAERLGGIVLPTGSVRLTERTPVRELAGYNEGAWWVQDAAAALPARLLAARRGERVIDLCAAPGGKTAQLASAGVEVLAVDRSVKRLQRLQENMKRLRLAVEVRAADALDLDEAPADGVLLDAPCSATGTIRRHPDVAWTKRPEDVVRLADLQRRLLDKAATLVRPGGRLVYCTCSLEPEEGEGQVGAFLARQPLFSRLPIQMGEIGGLSELLDARGDLRTLPCHLAELGPGRAGLDGFYVARLVRRADGPAPAH